MTAGKQIRHYREKLEWGQKELSIASGVEVGTISALEVRGSKRSNFLPQIAKAFGLTLEQLLDSSRDYTLNPPSAETAQHAVRDTSAAYPATRSPDSWLAEAMRILEALNAEDRRAAVLCLRAFVMNLGPPRDGQALSVAG